MASIDFLNSLFLVFSTCRKIMNPTTAAITPIPPKVTMRLARFLPICLLRMVQKNKINAAPDPPVFIARRQQVPTIQN
jgi:hypothetical protein